MSISSERGFSLMEIMAALAILAIVGTLVVTSVTGQMATAKVNATKTVISSVESALSAYRRDCNRYPSTEEGLAVLVEKPANCPNWAIGGYFEKSKMPKDAWNFDLIYNSPPTVSQKGKFEVISLGADGVEGGEDEEADINSNDL